MYINWFFQTRGDSVKLFHISTRNKQLNLLDMTIHKKNDLKYVFYIFDSAISFEEFLFAFNSKITKACSEEKGWSIEKLAAEAIFEYVRVQKHPESPSRLFYAYFSDSYEKAIEFNRKWRSDAGAIFEFTADIDKIFYYDMDIFDDAVKLFEKGVTQKSYEDAMALAEIYWNAKSQKNIEILYKGYPVLTRI